MQERELEKKLYKEMKSLGGMAFKFTSPGNNGMPDRICIFPGGLLVFVEMKRPKGGVISPVQKEQQKRLRALGQKVENIFNPVDLEIFKETYYGI